MDGLNIQIFPKTVDIVVGFNGSLIYLVGTTHYSQESQEDVAKVINMVKPDSVVLGLCRKRTNLLAMEEPATSNTSDVKLESLTRSIWTLGFTRGIFYQAIVRISANITRDLGVISGKEFRRAVEEARKFNSIIYYGDRPIDITVKRMIATLNWSNSIKLLAHMLFTKFKINKNDVEKLKSMDLLGTAMDKLVSDYPELERVIVDERNEFLTHRLQHYAGIGVIYSQLDPMAFSFAKKPQVIVAVVEMNQIIGIRNYWQKISVKHVKELLIVPKQSNIDQVLQHVTKASVIGLFLWGYSKRQYLKELPSMICHILARA